MRYITALLTLACILHAKTTTIPPETKTLSLTVYNNNLAFIHEIREVALHEGKQQIRYEGIPSKVITQSVIPTFMPDIVTIYSQNYIYNLITRDALLQKSIGQMVGFYPNNKEGKLQTGTLLAMHPAVVVKKSTDGKIYILEKPSQVILEKMPPDMITRPSLLWNIEAQSAAKADIDLKYLTRGIGWKSDYILDLQKEKLNLTGWITITNNSGTAYKNAAINCVAGELHTLTPPPVTYRNLKTAEVAMAPAPVQEEAFSGYHLYKIPFKESIGDHEQKQILFIEKKGVGYHRYGKCLNTYFENYGTQKLHFENIITFKNSTKNGLGIALPAGTVRMYRKDSSGASHYIGEDRLPNTPADEKIKLTVGTLFDVTGQKRITRFKATRSFRDVETTYEVHNRSKETMELHIEEQIPAYGTKVTLKTSCKDPCRVEKRNALARVFIITLPPKSDYRFTSAFEVIY